jgi:hypothetical protein
MRDFETMRAYTAMLAAPRAENESKTIQIACATFSGFLDVLDGRWEIGLNIIQSNLDQLQGADHAPGQRGITTRIFLECCAIVGDTRRGLALAEMALALPDPDRLWESEIRRFRAEFLAALDAPATEVVAELERALALAHSQCVSIFELRAACRLLHYLKGRGDVEQAAAAKERLANIVNGFAGIQTYEDFRVAIALLNQN